MKADEVLVGHHMVLRSLLEQLTDSSRAEVELRRELLDRLVAELSIHAQIEDEIFYPAVRAVSPLVGIAHAEHRQLDDQLATVLRTDPGGERFAEEVRVLRSSLEHHAGEEETEMFPQSQALGEAELEALGDRLRSRLEQLRGSRLTELRLTLKRETLRRLGDGRA